MTGDSGGGGPTRGGSGPVRALTGPAWATTALVWDDTRRDFRPIHDVVADLSEWPGVTRTGDQEPPGMAP